MNNLPNLRLLISPFLFDISLTAHALTTEPYLPVEHFL